MLGIFSFSLGYYGVNLTKFNIKKDEYASNRFDIIDVKYPQQLPAFNKKPFCNMVELKESLKEVLNCYNDFTNKNSSDRYGSYRTNIINSIDKNKITQLNNLKENLLIKALGK